MSSIKAVGSYPKEEMTHSFHPGLLDQLQLVKTWRQNIKKRDPKKRAYTGRDVGFLLKGNAARPLLTKRNGSQLGHSKSQPQSGIERCETI